MLYRVEIGGELVTTEAESMAQAVLDVEAEKGLEQQATAAQDAEDGALHEVLSRCLKCGGPCFADDIPDDEDCEDGDEELCNTCRGADSEDEFENCEPGEFDDDDAERWPDSQDPEEMEG